MIPKELLAENLPILIMIIIILIKLCTCALTCTNQNQGSVRRAFTICLRASMHKSVPCFVLGSLGFLVCVCMCFLSSPCRGRGWSMSMSLTSPVYSPCCPMVNLVFCAFELVYSLFFQLDDSFCCLDKVTC